MDEDLSLRENENEEVRDRRTAPAESQDLEKDHQDEKSSSKSRVSSFQKITPMPSSHPWMLDNDENHERDDPDDNVKMMVCDKTSRQSMETWKEKRYMPSLPSLPTSLIQILFGSAIIQRDHFLSSPLA